MPGLKVDGFEQVEISNRVREEVAESYAKTHARYAQIGTNESAIRSGLLSFTQDLTRIRARARDVLPIELLDSFRLLAGARIDYVDAIVDYNEAQFRTVRGTGAAAGQCRWPIPCQSRASRRETFRREPCQNRQPATESPQTRGTIPPPRDARRCMCRA